MNINQKINRKEYLTALEMTFLLSGMLSSKYPNIDVTIAKPPIFADSLKGIKEEEFNYYKYVAMTLVLFATEVPSPGVTQVLPHRIRLGYITVRVNFHNDFSSFEFFDPDYHALGKHKLAYSKSEYTLLKYIQLLPELLEQCYPSLKGGE